MQEPQCAVLARLGTPVVYELLAPDVGLERHASRAGAFTAQVPTLHHS